MTKNSIILISFLAAFMIIGMSAAFAEDCNNDIDGDGLISVECGGTDCDDDDDGFDSMLCFDGTDCADDTEYINPSVPEVCNDAFNIDDDCDDNINCADPDCWNHFYCTDDDGDGIKESEGDCDDTDIYVYPLADELCDGKDNNCDNIIPTDEIDYDSDTYMICDGDCNDIDASINPGAPEICDGIDNNCDNSTDEFDIFGEQGYICTNAASTCTGYYVCSIELDSVCYFPQATAEICGDGIDNDCDGYEDCADYDCCGVTTGKNRKEQLICSNFDSDNDDYLKCAYTIYGTSYEADCDDNDASINPGATELCDEKDNDCDSSTTEELIFNLDGYCEVGICSGQYVCSADAQGSVCKVQPTEQETCNNSLDDDCDGLTDCSDPNCSEDPACSEPAACDVGQCLLDGICYDEGTCTGKKVCDDGRWVNPKASEYTC